MWNKSRVVWILIFILLGIAALFYFLQPQFFSPTSTIKVGILFSKTGTMAESEEPVINATLLAIDEINQRGGIHQKRIIPIVYDGQSNWKRYAVLAKKMITEDDVKVIFGSWTSASRKEVKPIVEKYNSLLVYPTQYEGAEESPNIIYLGATPNQQIVPAVSWFLSHHNKKRAFLVGSDYIFPHVANAVIEHEVKSLGGTIVGTRYIPLGSADVDKIIDDIIKESPDIIFNTINGDTNIAFFNRLYKRTKLKKRPPVMSFSLSSADIHKIGTNKMIGDYAVWSYFITQTNLENKIFLRNYQAKYGLTENINDPAVTAYAGVYLWAQAAQESPSIEPNEVRGFMLRQSTASPAGVIYIDPANAHAWRTVMIGRVNEKGSFSIIWTSYNPIEPIVYPDFKTKTEWDLFEYQLYKKWHNAWENSK